ncbi:enolase C-terminal domain-like protein [Halobacteriovorax sp. RT-2-6]|uniref:enolase C-terminal domain-like protein n=1 Tax=unclassified Halobacteriovorax TaxID=2639665 RepID=UPI00399AA576
MEWAIDTRLVNLNKPWKISGAEVLAKEIIYVTLKNGEYKGVGEISYGSKENICVEDLKQELERFASDYENAGIVQYNELTQYLDQYDFYIPRLRLGVETAFLDYLVKATELSPWKILGTNTVKSVDSLDSFPVFETIEEGRKLLDDADTNGVIKLKITHETFPVQVQLINESKRVFVLDANESYGSNLELLLEHLAMIEDENVLFIEQPLYRNEFDLYKELKEKSPIDVFLDEGIEDHRFLDPFKDLCHGVVLKTSKANGLMKTFSQLQQAKKLGLKTMLGCMVESTVGIASLFNIAYGFDYFDFDGFTKLKDDSGPHVIWEKGKVILSNMN